MELRTWATVYFFALVPHLAADAHRVRFGRCGAVQKQRLWGNSDQHFARRLARVYGKRKKGNHDVVGSNRRKPEIRNLEAVERHADEMRKQFSGRRFIKPDPDRARTRHIGEEKELYDMFRKALLADRQGYSGPGTGRDTLLIKQAVRGSDGATLFQEYVEQDHDLGGANMLNALQYLEEEGEEATMRKLEEIYGEKAENIMEELLYFAENEIVDTNPTMPTDKDMQDATFEVGRKPGSEPRDTAVRRRKKVELIGKPETPTQKLIATKKRFQAKPKPTAATSLPIPSLRKPGAYQSVSAAASQLPGTKETLSMASDALPGVEGTPAAASSLPDASSPMLPKLRRPGDICDDDTDVTLPHLESVEAESQHSEKSGSSHLTQVSLPEKKKRSGRTKRRLDTVAHKWQYI